MNMMSRYFFSFSLALLASGIIITQPAIAGHSLQLTGATVDSVTCSKPVQSLMVAGDTITVNYTLISTNAPEQYETEIHDSPSRNNEIFFRDDVTASTSPHAGSVTFNLSAPLVSSVLTIAFDTNNGSDQVANFSCPATAVTPNVASNFMKRRVDQITANDPNLVNRLNGGNGSSGGNAFDLAASSLGGNTNVAFGTSLRQIANAKKTNSARSENGFESRMSLGHGVNGKAVGGTAVNNGFDVWVEGKWLRSNSATADSTLGLFYVGADYRLNSSLLVGVLGQMDWTNEDGKDVFGSRVDGRGWMIGPYVVARLRHNLKFDGRVAWGQSDNDISPLGTFTDSFDTDRWLIKGQLTGAVNYDRWLIAPHVGLIYFEETQKSYVDNFGLRIRQQTVSLGRVTFGPRISTNFTASSGNVISPYVALKGIWDFDDVDTVNVISGAATGSDDLRGRIEAGVSLTTLGGATITGGGFYDGIGANDLEVYGGRLRLSVPLH